MKRSLLLAAIGLALVSQGNAFAESIEARLQRLENENRQLKAAIHRHGGEIRRQQAAVQRQEAAMAEQQARLEGTPDRLQALEKGLEEKMAADEGQGGNWFERIALGGLIEVEAGYFSPEEGDDESDILLATFELGLGAQVNDWIEAGAALLYEEDETDLEVDIAFIRIANPGATPLFATAGQIYVPFGAYETNLVSDPLTLEIGETRETTLELGASVGDLTGSLYAFNGDNKIDGENEIGSWGASLRYGHEANGLAWALGADYISDLGDSDSLQEIVGADLSERTGGWTVSAMGAFGPVTLIGEYLSAAEAFAAEDLSFKGHGAKPSAWNVEAGFHFDVMGRGSVAAVAYQQTDEALGMGLPEERWLIGWSVEILERTALSFEWAHDTDYGQSHGGSGDSADTLVAQLAVEF